MSRVAELDKLVRFHSLESGNFDANNNVINFQIPSDTYNLQKSFVEFEMSVSTVDTTPGVGTAVYNVEILYNNQELPIYNSALIRNSRVSTEMTGFLEEINNVDVLRANLDHFGRSVSNKSSLSYKSLFQLYDEEGEKHSIFRDYNIDNLLKSRNVNARVRIPLSDLMGIGMIPYIDTSRVGQINHRLELNCDKISARVVGYQDVPCNDIANPIAIGQDEVVLTANYPDFNSPFAIGHVCRIQGNGTGAADLNAIKTIIGLARVAGVITLQFNSNLPALGGGELWDTVRVQRCINCGGVANGVAAITTLTLLNGVSSLSSIPFYNGCLVRVTATGTNGAADIDAYTLVDSVAWDQDTGITTFTFPATLGDTTGGGAETYEDVTVSLDLGGVAGGAEAAATLNWLSADVVMHQQNTPPAQIENPAPYYAYELEENSAGNVVNYHNTYILPPNCVNAYTFFVNIDANPYSILDVVDKYRLQIDSKNLSQRPIEIDSPLYYSELSNSMFNGEMELNNLLGLRQGNERNPILSQTDSKRVIMVSTPTKLTNQNKLMQMTVNCSAVGVNNVFLYKMLSRSI